jgi:O-acetyl-ADP-ribose deacetylase (regulator of RNase III)
MAGRVCSKENTMRIEVIKGDLTKQSVDAIVNAANETLLGGGGVDGAIHDAAGPSLREECLAFPILSEKGLVRCKTGDAKVTKGYNLPAKWVVHTVGPVWVGGLRALFGHRKEEKLLADCYRNSLRCAVEIGAETIAFPSISTGVYAFPIDRAAAIAHATVREFLATNDTIKKVTFVCFGSDAYQAYLDVMDGKGD